MSFPAWFHALDLRLLYLVNQTWSRPWLDPVMARVSDFDSFRYPLVAAVILTLIFGGFRGRQFLVLMALAETGEVCQQFLAGVIGIDPRNIVPILDSLGARGLVSRETDPDDRRRRLIELTSDGRRIVAELSALGEQTERELLATVPSADRESLRRILRTVLDAARQSG